MFITEKDYVISGIRTKDNVRVFIAIDDHSGGYPYWSPYYRSAKHYGTPTNRSDLMDCILQEVSSWEVLEVQVVGEVVPTDSAIDFARAEAQKKIDAIRGELQAELDNLARIK